MSVRMMSLVWELQLPDSEKLVLLALADCANDEGHCWPSMATIAKKCSKSDRTAQLAIKMLCTKGHLTRREVPGKGCNYTVHPIVRLSDPRSAFTPEAASPRNDCATPPKPVRATPEAASDKPSLNHKEPSNIPAAPDPIDLFQEAWNALPAAAGAVHCNKLKDDRRRRAGKFLRTHTEDEISDALHAVAASKFLTGQTKERFRADIEFLFSPRHMTRIQEGFYGEPVSKIAA